MILIIKHISIEGPGIIAHFFKNKTCKVKTVKLDKGDRLPENLSGIEAVVSLGGPMNAYEEDKFSFLKDEDIFLKKALTEEIPMKGKNFPVFCLKFRQVRLDGGVLRWKRD